MPRAAVQDIRAAVGSTSGAGSFTLDTAGWTAFTGFGWFKNNVNGSTDNLLARSAGFTDRVCQIQSDGKLRFCLACVSGNLNAFTVTQYKPGAWHHFVAVYDGSTYAFYVDGVLESSGPAAGGNLAASQGTSWAISNAANNPSLSQLGIYNRALSATEAKQIYQGTVATSGLQRYWKMNEGAGNTFIDYSTNAQNAAVGSLTFISDTPTKKRQTVGGNLVVNGDFEYAPPFTAAYNSTSGKWNDGTAAGSSTNTLFAWAQLSKAGSGTWQFDSSQFHSGSQSLKLSITAASSTLVVSTHPSSTAANMLAYGIPVRPNTAYTFTYWMKTNYTSGDGIGAEVDVVRRNAAGTSVGSSSVTAVKTTTGWTQYNISLTTESTAYFVTIQPTLNGTSSTADLIMDAWFDDIVLTETVPLRRVLANPVRSVMQFNGTSAYVLSTTAPIFYNTLSKNYTIHFRIKATLQTNDNKIFQWNRSSGNALIQITTTATNKIIFFVRNDSGTVLINTSSTAAVLDGNWHHIAISDNNGVCTMYIDGRADATNFNYTPSGTFASLNVTALGANYTTSASQYFAGLVSNFVILSQAVTAAQAMTLSAGGSTGITPALVWPLDEGAGPTAQDSSGNANNGTITGATYSSDVPSKKRQTVGGNMVPNGDFEYIPPFTALTTAGVYVDGTTLGSSTNNLFGAWANVSGQGPGSAGTQFDNTNSHSGTGSMKLSLLSTSGSLVVAQGIGTGIPSTITDMMPMLPNTSYTLSVWVKTNNVAASAVWLDLRQYTAAGSALVTTNTTKVTGTTGWTQYTFTVTTQPTCYWGRIFLRNNVVGNISDAWFDDIILKPTTNTTRTTVT